MSHPSDLLVPVSTRDHSQGDENAPITLVEYGDFECPYCGSAYSILKVVQQELGRELRFVFRNFPLTQPHPHAELAAEAAEAAGAQGKYWPMHDALYENQQKLSLELILNLGDSLGLDTKRFFHDLEKRHYLPRVREDFMGGVRSGVNGTPGFFINGMRYQAAWDARSLVKALRQDQSRREAS